MKTSVKKHNRWIYIILVLMILALIGFSLLPIFDTLISQSNSNNNATAIDTTKQKLESEIKGYELVLQKESDNQTALRGILEAKLKLGDIPGAIAPLEALAQLNPQQTDYTVLVAQAKQQIQDYEGAANAYRQILATVPGEIKALKGLINLYLLQNRPEAAIGILEDTLKTANFVNSPNSTVIDVTSIKLLLGEVYVSQKRDQDAIALYDNLIKDNGTDFRPLLAKGLLLREKEKFELAEPLFKAALELAPPEYKDQIKQLTLKS